MSQSSANLSLGEPIGRRAQGNFQYSGWQHDGDTTHSRARQCGTIPATVSKDIAGPKNLLYLGAHQHNRYRQRLTFGWSDSCYRRPRFLSASPCGHSADKCSADTVIVCNTIAYPNECLLQKPHQSINRPRNVQIS